MSLPTEYFAWLSSILPEKSFCIQQLPIPLDQFLPTTYTKGKKVNPLLFSLQL